MYALQVCAVQLFCEQIFSFFFYLIQFFVCTILWSIVRQPRGTAATLRMKGLKIEFSMKVMRSDSIVVAVHRQIKRQQ